MSDALEPGLYVGRRVLHRPDGDRELNTVVVKVSGAAPWLKMELMKPADAIDPGSVSGLTRLDQED